KTLMVSEVAYNISSTIEEKKQIINNLFHFSKKIGYTHFNIGLLSSVESPHKKIQSSVDAEKIKHIFNREANDYLNIDGPILFDNAISKKDRKSTRLNSSHVSISYAVFCLKKKIK